MRLLDVLPVTAAVNAVGVSPRSLIVTCQKLEAVDQVLFNGIAAPSFVVHGDNQLIAEVPEVLDQATITDVAVLSAVPTLTERSLVELGLGKGFKTQSGVQRLVQTFIRLLFRTQGSNVFHPTLGGNIQASVGRNFSQQAAADVALAIASVRQQIITAQSAYASIPPSERLLSAEVAGLSEDPTSATLYCTVVLTAHDRARSAATLVS